MATAADVPVSIDNSEKQGKVEVDLASTSKPLKEKKIGHRRVDATTGQTTYKKTPSSTLSSAIQLGISHTVGKLVSKQERDVLMQDFQVVETTMFLAEGSNITPAHHYEDFRFKTYAPVAFRYFRDLFGIQPADYMLSISNDPLTELSNPGASGSLFFVTHDDEFIIKTVQHKEAEFLQKLLPGYYMNLVQNPRTLLPKFYGLYCIQAGGKNIRIVVMNNLLPRALKMHLKFDLKGSTFKRKASKNERAKNSPTFKDLDILTDLPDGVQLDPDVYAAFIKTMQRDCLVLQSFKIMDYSLLLGIHYVDKDKNRSENRDSQDLDGKKEKRKSSDSDSTDYSTDFEGKVVGSLKKQRPLYNNKPTDSIMSSTLLREKYHTDLDIWTGGIPATSPRGDRLLLFCGIIDILQCYKLKKKLEHTIKAALYDADSVSVHRPGFYCDRFQKFMSDHVFKKTPGPVKTQPSKKRAQTTRKVNDGQFGGVTSAAKNSSPAVHSKASTPRQGGKKLQSDRPDLLPSESPRPWSNGNDSQDEQPDTSSQMQYKTPPRMQIKMEERSPNLSNDISHEPSLPPSSYKSTNDVDKQLLSNFSTHQKETTFKGPAYSSSVDVSDLQAVKVDQVQLQWKENSAHGEPVTSGSDEKIQDFNPVDENKDMKQLSNFIVEKENGQPISENNSTEAPKRVIQDTAF